MLPCRSSRLIWCPHPAADLFGRLEGTLPLSQSLTESDVAPGIAIRPLIDAIIDQGTI